MSEDQNQKTTTVVWKQGIENVSLFVIQVFTLPLVFLRDIFPTNNYAKIKDLILPST